MTPEPNFTFRFDVFLHQANETAIEAAINALAAKVGLVLDSTAALHSQGAAMSAQLDTLTQEVTEIGTVVDSAITLINGLAQQIRDLADDPAAILALANSLDAKAAALADAVNANTPPAPAPAP